MLGNGLVTRGCAFPGPVEWSSHNLAVCSNNIGQRLAKPPAPLSFKQARRCCWSPATAVAKRHSGDRKGVPHIREHRLRLCASTWEADTDVLTQDPTLDTDLQRKCLKAAVHLQEHGWAVLEGVLSP